MGTKKLEAPSVFDHLDVVVYLKCHLEWRKKNEPKFSLAAWSSELGLSNKTLLTLILKRERNITPSIASALKSSLGLTVEEVSYFDNLIDYTQAKSRSQREAFGTSLSRLQRIRYEQVQVQPQDIAKHAIGPVLLTMMTFKDLPLDARQLAKALGEEESVIMTLLNEFQASGMMSAETTSPKSTAAYKIPDKANDLNLRKFYEYWLGRAKAAIDMPSETRKFRALQFALSEDEYAEVIEKLNEFAMSLLSRFHNDNIAGRRLYMYEGALFPITEKISIEASEV